MSELIRNAPQEVQDVKTSSDSSHRLIIASNRLPMEFKKDAEGNITAKPTIGGLKTSVERVVQNGEYDGVWVGSADLTQEEIEGLDEALGPDTNGNHTEYAFVSIPPDIYRRYYLNDANGQKWMWFHWLKDHALPYADENYQASRLVNEMFARKIAEYAGEGAIAMPQDYHLPYVGEELERLGVDISTMHYSHIPLPEAGYIAEMPRIREYINALTKYDVTSFQDPRFLRNFIDSVKLFGDYEEIKDIDEGVLVKSDGRYTLATASPIGIDPEDYNQVVDDPEVLSHEEYHRAGIPQGGKLYGGVSRDEITKGVFQFLEGFEYALDTTPDMRGLLYYDRVLAQQRNLPVYHENRRQIDEITARINSKFEKDYRGRPPVRILPKVDKHGVVGLFKAVDVIEAASLADGRNLTADEGTIVNERSATLLVGERSGAAGNLGVDAVVANPWLGKEHMGERIIYAATLPEEIRKVQSENRKRTVNGHTVFHWTERNIRALQISTEINRQNRTV